MQFLIPILLTGAMSFANPGVLENVAKNRAAGVTVHDVRQNWGDFDVLLAVEECEYINMVGLLYLEDGTVLSALVVDCQQKEHRENGGALSDLGLLADVNDINIVHMRAALFLGWEVFEDGKMVYRSSIERKVLPYERRNLREY